MDSSVRISLIAFIVISANVYLQSASARSLHKRAAFYIANETACVVDNIVYYNGDPIPTDDPCESCKCRPPGFACVLRECEVKPGCRAVRRTGHCCPEYICGCEHDGRMYRDGDEIRDAQNPCYTCFCQGSAIACSFTDCFFRVDCTPEYIQGECCPVYNHCPSIGAVQNQTFSQDQSKTPSATIFTTTEIPKDTTMETSSTGSVVIPTEGQKDKDSTEAEEIPKEENYTPTNADEETTTQKQEVATNEIWSTVNPNLLYVSEDVDETSSENDSSEEEEEKLIPSTSTTTERNQDKGDLQTEKPTDETHEEKSIYYSESLSDDSVKSVNDEPMVSTIKDTTTEVKDGEENHKTTTESSHLFKSNDEAIEITKSESSEDKTDFTYSDAITTQDSEEPKITPLPILFHNAESDIAIEGTDEKKSMAILDGNEDDVTSTESDSEQTLDAQKESTPQEPTVDDKSATEISESEEMSNLLNSNTELKKDDEDDDDHTSIPTEQVDKSTTAVEEPKNTPDNEVVDKETVREGKINEEPITTIKSSEHATDITTTKQITPTTMKIPAEFTEKAPVYSEELNSKQTSTESTSTEKHQPTTLAIIESTTRKESTTQIEDKTTTQ